MNRLQEKWILVLALALVLFISLPSLVLADETGAGAAIFPTETCKDFNNAVKEQ